MTAMLQSYPISTFKELSLNGVCSYHINGEWLGMDVEEIFNNRDNGNTSGTLSLEIWALPAPYEGGAFSGCALAATTLGELRGQRCYRQLRLTLPLQNPAEGSWHIVMMLREWDGGAYVTRDYINFPETLTARSRIVLSLDGLPIIYRR